MVFKINLDQAVPEVIIFIKDLSLGICFANKIALGIILIGLVQGCIKITTKRHSRTPRVIAT